VRLLLDAHVSGRRVGPQLRRRGHDVRAIDGEPALEGLDDELLLALARDDRRILVTFNIHDFPSIVREWASAGRPHAGVILVYGLGTHEYGRIARGVEQALAQHSRQTDWADLTEIVSPAGVE
jgi:hypothetical protein